MIGDDASKLRSMLEVNYPMENGIVRYEAQRTLIVHCSSINCYFLEIGKTCAMYGTIHLAQRR